MDKNERRAVTLAIGKRNNGRPARPAAGPPALHPGTWVLGEHYLRLRHWNGDSESGRGYFGISSVL